MAGDINAYLIEEEINSDAKEKAIELSIMISERQSRFKGLAQESLALMITYMDEKRLCGEILLILAKIDEDNLPSLNLFKKMNFTQLRHDRYFNSFTYKFDTNYLEKIRKNFPLQIQIYDR